MLTSEKMVPKKRKTNATEERLLEIQEKLTKWNSFVRDLHVPNDMAPAFLTGRMELLCLAKPRALTEEECKQVYELIGGILETNNALREHAAMVADLADRVIGGLHALERPLQQLRDFGNFRTPVDDGEDDEG